MVFSLQKKKKKHIKTITAYHSRVFARLPLQVSRLNISFKSYRTFPYKGCAECVSIEKSKLTI